MATTEKRITFEWEKGPMRLIATPQFTTGKVDQYTETATAMANVHNSIIRSFNVMYLQATKVPRNDYQNFIGYCRAWYDFVYIHHEGEERELFPLLERLTGQRGLMDANVKQHEVFQAGLDHFKAYLDSCWTKLDSFDGAKFISIMDSFQEALQQHLEDEITTLLRLAPYGDKLNMFEIMEEEASKSMAKLSKFGALPLFFLNHDVEFEGGLHHVFPPGAPAFMIFLFKKVFPYWYWGYWKFASCDGNGKPKDLYYK